MTTIKKHITQSVQENLLEKNTLNNQLITMAADPEIQRELQEIDKDFLTAELDGLETSNTPKEIRVLGLHKGSMQMHNDFDDPLPDTFWLGEE